MDAQKKDLAKKDQKLQEKEKEAVELQKENVKIKEEIKQEKDKFNSEWGCNDLLVQSKNNAYLVWGQKP